MRDVHSALADNVRRLRAQHGLTLVQVAELAKVSRATIMAVEGGKRADGRATRVTLDTAARLAVVLGVTLDQLVG